MKLRYLLVLLIAWLIIAPPIAAGVGAGLASLISEVGAALAAGIFLLALVVAIAALWLFAPQRPRPALLYEPPVWRVDDVRVITLHSLEPGASRPKPGPVIPGPRYSRQHSGRG